MLVTRLEVFVNLHDYHIIVHGNIYFIYNKHAPLHFKSMGMNKNEHGFFLIHNKIHTHKKKKKKTTFKHKEKVKKKKK